MLDGQQWLLSSVIYPIGKGAVALGQLRRGRSTDRGCSRHDSGVEPDEGAESERAVGRADEAEIRREEEQTDGGAAAESRPAELPGEPSEAKGCRGGARAEAGGRGRARRCVACTPGMYLLRQKWELNGERER